MINFESFYPCSTVFLKSNCCNISETRPCCCVSEVRIRAKPDQVLRSLPEASNDVSPSHIPMTFCYRQTSVIQFIPVHIIVSTPCIYLSMAPLTCLAFLRQHSWLLQFSLRSGDYLLSHYFPELAPICRMSGLMGSDVKIDHNLQLSRPLPPVMMPRPGLSLSWPTEWLGSPRRIRRREKLLLALKAYQTFMFAWNQFSYKCPDSCRVDMSSLHFSAFTLLNHAYSCLVTA